MHTLITDTHANTLDWQWFFVQHNELLSSQKIIEYQVYVKDYADAKFLGRQFWDCGRWKSDSLWNFSYLQSLPYTVPWPLVASFGCATEAAKHKDFLACIMSDTDGISFIQAISFPFTYCKKSIHIDLYQWNIPYLGQLIDISVQAP